MKVGDLVGWWDHDDENLSTRLAGIIIDASTDNSFEGWNENYTKFLILMTHNGQLSWEYGSDLKVIYEDR